jgi:poly(A)-specific ribonuclease
MLIPSTVVDPNHNKYDEKSMFHEAGYDSLLTAEVFIKLSAQLSNHSQLVSAPVIANHATRVDRLAILEGTPTSKDSRKDKVVDIEEHSKLEKQGNRSNSDPKGQSRFAHQTRFNILAQQLDSIDLQDGNSPITARSEEVELIPDSQSSFWTIYSNKLRVFGTEERVFLLKTSQNPSSVVETSE